MGYKRGDVTHITTHQLAFLGPCCNIKNCIVTTHDLIQHYWFGLGRSIREKWLPNEYLLGKMERYIADSVSTKNDLVQVYQIPEWKITVIYLGVDHATYYPRNKDECKLKLGLDLDQKYLLAVSSGMKWKNTAMLKELPYSIIDIGYGRGKFGTVPEQDMPELYSACDAFLAPSLHEGFCLPVVEAMACGTTVVGACATALPEVIGSGGIIVDPYQPEGWVEGIEKALKYQHKWSQRAVARASQFSWEKTCRETVRIYAEYE
jgi:glycosyltransferase involved in cell wall biosynthesis